MIVKIQILLDDGTTVVTEHVGNALATCGQAFPPGQPIVEHGQKLYGFCYLPFPPPPLYPADVEAFRRPPLEHFGN